jgi:hypothetical protein
VGFGRLWIFCAIGEGGRGRKCGRLSFRWGGVPFVECRCNTCFLGFFTDSDGAGIYLQVQGSPSPVTLSDVTVLNNIAG